MFSQVSLKEKVLYGIGCCLAFGAIIAVGLSCQKKPTDKITFEKLGPISGPKEKPPSPSSMTVHVAGAVKKPGVYRLKEGARVQDAIRAAGGLKPTADEDILNLAASLEDGVKIRIPSKQEKRTVVSRGKRTRPSAIEGNLPIIVSPSTEIVEDLPRVDAIVRSDGTDSFSETKPAKTQGRKKSPPPPNSISINSASATELQRLPGIGPATAEKIIAYRKEKNGFSTIEELMMVSGVGKKKFAAIEQYLRL